MKATIGTDHSDYATCLNHIGSIHSAIGKYEEALQTHSKCRQIFRETLG